MHGRWLLGTDGIRRRADVEQSLRHDVGQMPRKPIDPDPRDAELRDLRNSLYFARSTIIDLMPDPLREPLEAATRCRTIEDVRAWQAWAIARVVSLADRRSGYEMGGDAGVVRAYCPLCGGGSHSPSARGFAMPIGLERHLEGSHGSRQCGVFAAAIEPCYEQIREESRPGYRGPNWHGLPDGLRPWEIAAPEPPKAERPSANVIKLRGG